MSFTQFSPSYPYSVPPPPPNLELRSASAPTSSFWSSAAATQRARLRALAVEEEDDDDLNIDTSNMTQEEKNELKAQRKLRKMQREKVKRSRVNDQFDELCRVLHMGKSTRVEKLTVLNETLRAIYQLKADNKLLQEQTRQMRQLLARRQNGLPVTDALSDLTQTQEVKLSALSPTSSLISSKRPVTRARTREESAVCIGKPSMDSKLKHEQEAFLLQEECTLKQEMMPFTNGKCDVVLAKEAPSEECLLSWNAMFAQPQQNDLDFAFGDSNFTWMNHPRQDCTPAFVLESECEFNPFVIPKPDHDSMDLFLTTSDECDLLC